MLSFFKTNRGTLIVAAFLLIIVGHSLHADNQPPLFDFDKYKDIDYIGDIIASFGVLILIGLIVAAIHGLITKNWR